MLYTNVWRKEQDFSLYITGHVSRSSAEGSSLAGLGSQRANLYSSVLTRKYGSPNGQASMHVTAVNSSGSRYDKKLGSNGFKSEKEKSRA
jgi:hypothetical protein